MICKKCLKVRSRATVYTTKTRQVFCLWNFVKAIDHRLLFRFEPFLYFSHGCMKLCCVKLSKYSIDKSDIFSVQTYSIFASEPMNWSIFNIHCYNTPAFPFLHNKIQYKIFNKEITIISQGTSVQSVEEGMSRTISYSTTSTIQNNLPLKT